MASFPAKAGEEKRLKVRAEFWPNLTDEDLWNGPKEKGYFCAPRILPLLLTLLEEKTVKAKKNRLSSVYLELLSRHMGQGIIAMTSAEDHAYSAGYTGSRAVRSWNERMAALEELGLIASRRKGGMLYGYVCLFRPENVIEKLRTADKISDEWWNLYTTRAMDVGKPHESKKAKTPAPADVIPMRRRKKTVNE